jgi:molecular chaperone DnaK
VRNGVQTALTNLREAMESGDLERIKSRTEALQQATYRLSEAAYQSAGAGAAPGGDGMPEDGAGTPGGARPDDEEVIEAEFKAEDR